MYDKNKSARKPKNDLTFYIKRCEDKMSFDIYVKVKANRCKIRKKVPGLYSISVKTAKPTGNTISMKKHVGEERIKLQGLMYPDTIRRTYSENGLLVEIVLYKEYYMSRRMWNNERRLQETIERICDEAEQERFERSTGITIYLFNNANKPYRG